MEVVNTSIELASEELLKGNVVVIDDFLDATAYQELAGIAERSWKQRFSGESAWRLNVKLAGKPARLPLHTLPDMSDLNERFQRSSKTGVFSYWFYATTVTDRDVGTDDFEGIDSIRRRILGGGLADTIQSLAIEGDRFQFSITYFDEQSLISNHNDFSSDPSNIYQLTVLYYLTGREKCDGGELIFKDRLKISPIRNRLVLFIPTTDTIHRVDPAKDNAGFSRLAFSGWFL